MFTRQNGSLHPTFVMICSSVQFSKKEIESEERRENELCTSRISAGAYGAAGEIMKLDLCSRHLHKVDRSKSESSESRIELKVIRPSVGLIQVLSK